MKLALTALTVANLKTEGIYWDKKLPAFGIRIGKIRKTWIVAADQTRIRRTLGHYPNMSLKTARDTARKLITPTIKPRRLARTKRFSFVLSTGKKKNTMAAAIIGVKGINKP